MLADCWLSIADLTPELAGEKTQPRPFIADAVVSHLPILAHTHAAEILQVPLVLLSIQPDIPPYWGVSASYHHDKAQVTGT